MRKTVVLVLALTMLVGLFIVPAAAASSSGCNGVENAMTKANANGKKSLEVVAAKLGCGTTVPDPMACPSGTVELATYRYVGSLTGPIDHGYPTWVGAFELVSGTAASAGIAGDAGGFYWSGAVSNIVLKSFTGEIVTIGAVNPVSQNNLTNRTGMEYVRFCGAA